MKLFAVVLLVFLAGCISQEPVMTEFEIGGDLGGFTLVQDVELPVSKHEAQLVAENACTMYKLMECHGLHSNDHCDYWLMVDIYGDPCDARAARVCVDEAFVECFEDGFITNTAYLDKWKCALKGCPEDSRMCSDGTIVSRKPPNCEFPVCS